MSEPGNLSEQVCTPRWQRSALRQPPLGPARPGPAQQPQLGAAVGAAPRGGSTEPAPGAAGHGWQSGGLQASAVPIARVRGVCSAVGNGAWPLGLHPAPCTPAMHPPPPLRRMLFRRLPRGLNARIPSLQSLPGTRWRGFLPVITRREERLEKERRAVCHGLYWQR